MKSNRAVVILWILFAGACIGVGLLAFSFTRTMVANYTGVGINPFRPGEVQGGATSESGALPTPVQVLATPHPWDGASRVTMLVMGIDYRDWVAGEGAPRSDSMMVVTFDPITGQGGFLSIPRDLWVEIPGFGHNRINTAYMFGEASQLPGGGPALAMQTVENLIGVPIQYYAVIDFHTFERFIDEIGGIDVLVREEMRIAPIGAETSIALEAKPYHFNGAEALAYARVRKGAGDDFGRAERQQQVILAVIDRIVGFDMLPGLIARAPALYQELATGVRTNLSLDQMISLAWSALRIPKEDIQRGVIAPPQMIEFYTRPDGAQVLRPVSDQIRVLRNSIFLETSAISP
ncbi:MAG: LCP family protein [Anaerolineales bacterium]|nr:LCP family protein [Anaerolineales bacterium]